jgi:hypothetical protein
MTGYHMMDVQAAVATRLQKMCILFFLGSIFVLPSACHAEELNCGKSPPLNEIGGKAKKERRGF